MFHFEEKFFLECHEQMVHQLSPNDDFICALLLPLAGSTTEELTDEENEQLPIDLQYLPIDKQRESDRDIQQILLETILLVRSEFHQFLPFSSLCVRSYVQQNRCVRIFVRNRSI